MSVESIGLIKRPRTSRGIDYGAERYVLARNVGLDREVWFVAGSQYWGGIGRKAAYAPSHVSLAELSKNYNRVLFEGRLSLRALEEYSKEIDSWLGCGRNESAASEISPQKEWTVEVMSS